MANMRRLHPPRWFQPPFPPSSLPPHPPHLLQRRHRHHHHHHHRRNGFAPEKELSARLSEIDTSVSLVPAFHGCLLSRCAAVCHPFSYCREEGAGVANEVTATSHPASLTRRALNMNGGYTGSGALACETLSSKSANPPTTAPPLFVPLPILTFASPLSGLCCLSAMCSKLAALQRVDAVSLVHGVPTALSVFLASGTQSLVSSVSTRDGDGGGVIEDDGNDADSPRDGGGEPLPSADAQPPAARTHAPSVAGPLAPALRPLSPSHPYPLHDACVRRVWHSGGYTLCDSNAGSACRVRYTHKTHAIQPRQNLWTRSQEWRIPHDSCGGGGGRGKRE